MNYFADLWNNYWNAAVVLITALLTLFGLSGCGLGHEAVTEFSNVLPTPSLHNIIDGRGEHAERFSNGCESFALSAQSPDVQNVRLTEPVCRIEHANSSEHWRPATQDAVSVNPVSRVRSPFKIAQEIVGLVPVQVINLITGIGAWNKGDGHEPMHHCPSDVTIHTKGDGWPTVTVMAKRENPHFALKQALDSAVATDFIAAFVSNYRFPNFDIMRFRHADASIAFAGLEPSRCINTGSARLF